MNKKQYRRAYSLYREIVLLEKQLIPNSDNANNYIWHQIKLLNIELSELDGWCAMEHYDDARYLDPYEDFNWIWFKFPMYISHEIEQAMKGKEPLSHRARERIGYFLDEKAVA